MEKFFNNIYFKLSLALISIIGVIIYLDYNLNNDDINEFLSLNKEINEKVKQLNMGEELKSFNVLNHKLHVEYNSQVKYILDLNRKMLNDILLTLNENKNNFKPINNK